MKIWLSTEIVDNYQRWKKVPEAFVVLEDHQTELDRVMMEAVKWANLCRECWVSDARFLTSAAYHDAKQFLSSPEVQAWREREKESV